jgi:hypothetical protein
MGVYIVTSERITRRSPRRAIPSPLPMLDLGSAPWDEVISGQGDIIISLQGTFENVATCPMNMEIEHLERHIFPTDSDLSTSN